MSPFAGKAAVVTGAGSGIGRALALGLAARGAKLALSDIDEAGLAETGALVRKAGGEADLRHVDVGDAASVSAYATEVKKRLGTVHQLYNNAGITRGSRPFLEMRPQDFAAIMRVNFDGVVNGTRAFLPHLIASGAGCLVNISSLNGLMAQPHLSAYVASKFAVRGFTETIRAEMLVAGHPVQVVVVHPGGVHTNIANSSIPDDAVLTEAERARAKKRIQVYNEKLLTMPPDEAARVILDGVARGRTRIVVTTQAVWVDRLVRLLPVGYVRRVAAIETATFGD
jgi:NAD(P)-dependent dehydrogenase (short-subunit alcohol dehydrogenase family)